MQSLSREARLDLEKSDSCNHRLLLNFAANNHNTIAIDLHRAAWIGNE